MIAPPDEESYEALGKVSVYIRVRNKRAIISIRMGNPIPAGKARVSDSRPYTPLSEKLQDTPLNSCEVKALGKLAEGMTLLDFFTQTPMLC